jgi:hypothetical protein
LAFTNPDSVTHTVVFANGLCSLNITAGNADDCSGGNIYAEFSYYAGRYAYTVDGKFPGTVVVTPLRRSVTLAARAHTIRGGTRLTLHGKVSWTEWNNNPPAPVVVLARHNSKQPFKPIATVRPRGVGPVGAYKWKLTVQPNITTTYIAEVTGQRRCYLPASICAHPQGQLWANPETRSLTIHIQH